jgi:hypothetical protein
MMLGLLLARAGVDVAVLEKQADFLRDFRGDTIHPSTLEVMHELGFLEEFLRLPHQEVRTLTAHIGDVSLPLADFSHLSTRCCFVAFMPQWDFLTFLAGQAARYPDGQHPDQPDRRDPSQDRLPHQENLLTDESSSLQGIPSGDEFWRVAARAMPEETHVRRNGVEASVMVS